ncbi:MAG: lysophospholipid acyltransferase family protein [Nitrospirae bacterium]|nr:lysophospholipid acyltransferase family protein [Nitrospirota bacterium]
MGHIRRFILKYIVPPLGFILIYILGITYRKVLVNKDIEKTLIDRGVNPIYALWHGRLLLFPFLYRWQYRLYTIVSLSTDGEIIARILSMLGVYVIRGSSYEGGTKAFREMVKVAKNKKSVFITVDGSRGPVFKVQGGVLHLARLGEVPVIPVTYGAKNAIVLKSWDRFIIPMPFTRVAVIYGEPLYIPRELKEEQHEIYRLLLEQRLNEMTTIADNYFRQ